jgi:uncharacterized protein
MSADDRLSDLNNLLLSQTDEDGMLLSEFDGFCAGVIVCPEVIPPKRVAATCFWWEWAP